MFRTIMIFAIALISALASASISNLRASPSSDECDRLTAHATDPTRPANVAPVDFGKIDAERAIPVCKQAVDEQPNTARMAFQLGRAFEKAGRQEDAIAFFKKAAQNGHVKAMVSLGSLYSSMHDAGEAKQWFQRAADAGFSEGFLELGNIYARGFGVTEDKQEAVRLWRRSAESGDPLGMSALGYAYLTGRGLAANEDEAYRWFHRAAEVGHLPSMVKVALLLFNGKGAAKDGVGALQWLHKAADRGNTDGMYYLGVAYWRGEGVAKDPQEAVRWLRKAAEAGHPAAMHDLAAAYAQGVGVEKNEAEAARWLRNSAEAGNLFGIRDLGNAYNDAKFGLTKDEAEAARWWRKGAQAGDPPSMNDLGVALAHGTGLSEDPAQAFAWFRKAADAGDVGGMRNLGVTYIKGIGTEKDEDQGIHWLKAAAEKGDETSKLFLWKLKPAIPRSLPSTEEFMGIVSACGTSNKISLDGNLRGSIQAYYEGLKIKGTISLTQSSELLSLFPEGQRPDAYKTYVSCVMAFVNKYQGSISESDVKLIKNKNADNEDTYQIALSAEAASRLDSFTFDDLISRGYDVTFSVTCSRAGGKIASRGPFVFKYAADFFRDLYSTWVIPHAYTALDTGLDEEDDSSEDEAKNKKNLSDLYSEIRDKNIILSVSLVKDMREKYKELSDDIDTVFGNGNCSPSDMTTDLFLLITTTGKDGFDDKHYFKLSGVITEILDGAPQVKATLDRSSEAEFVRAKNRKLSFPYERLMVMKSDRNDKILMGLGAVDHGMRMSKFDPNFVQPTVKFLRSVKASWR